MSLPLVVKSKLFWRYQGNLETCWYLGWGDGVTKKMQDAYIDDMDRFGADTITLNLLNEGICSPFSKEFMGPYSQQKVDLMFGFIDRLKARGKLIVIVPFDCPRCDGGKYPFWRFTERLGPFLQLAAQAFSPKVDGFIVGIETDRSPTMTAKRGLSLAELDAAVFILKENAYRMDAAGNKYPIPVGTHEAGFRIAPRADFIGVETPNHPVTQGDGTSVEQMVTWAKKWVVAAAGRPVWVIESNSSEGSIARAQNRAMAEIPGVVGVNMPI